MALIEDVNQKIGHHVAKNEYWESVGVRVLRCKLPYGDYIIAPPIVVDTKANVAELAMDVSSDHERFRDAAIKAADHGSVLVILVENEEGYTSLDEMAAWINPRNGINASRGKRLPINGVRLAKACKSMRTKYGLQFAFCHPSEAGQAVFDILRGEGEQWMSD